MKSAWTFASILFLGSLLTLVAAVWMLRSVQAQERLPDEFMAARERMWDSVGELGGPQHVNKAFNRLKDVRAAMSSDAELFSHRLGELFEQLGLAVMTSSNWRVAPGYESNQAAAFERTFTGVGRFDALVSVIRTVESWPDRARLRTLLVEPDAAGSVYFTLDIAVVRLRPSTDE